jgi:hypothetical protein
VHADRRGCREDVLFDAFPWCAHLELDDGEELVVRLINFLSLSVALVVVVFYFLSYSSLRRTRLPNGFRTFLSFPRERT